MADINVEINQNTDHKTLKVKWSTGSFRFSAYEVVQASINEHALNVRNALQELVSAGCESRQSEYGPLILSLSQRGYDFYEGLFLGATDSDRQTADKVRNWVANKVAQGKDRITFTVPSGAHYPWGLVYDQPEIDVPAGKSPDPKAFCHFWCAKYAAVTHYLEIPPVGIDVTWPSSKFKILFGAHEYLWNKVYPLLDDNEKAAVGDLLGSNQPLFSLENLKNAWKGEKPLGILNFYCHATNNMLCLGEKTLSANLFQQQFRRDEASDSEPPTLVLLAGCETAIRDLDGGFILATGGPGYCGFIGTEVKVPDIFTLRFLIRFLARFYTQGKTVGEVMQGLQREHWPLSLVFSMCCPRDVHLAIRDVKDAGNSYLDRVAALSDNLSFGKLSSAIGGDSHGSH